MEGGGSGNTKTSAVPRIARAGKSSVSKYCDFLLAFYDKPDHNITSGAGNLQPLILMNGHSTSPPLQQPTRDQLIQNAEKLKKKLK
jgi:hypothetical protein